MLEKVFLLFGIRGSVEDMLSTVGFFFLIGFFTGIWVMKKIEIGKNQRRS